MAPGISILRSPHSWQISHKELIAILRDRNPKPPNYCDHCAMCNKAVLKFRAASADIFLGQQNWMLFIHLISTALHPSLANNLGLGHPKSVARSHEAAEHGGAWLIMENGLAHRYSDSVYIYNVIIIVWHTMYIILPWISMNKYRISRYITSILDPGREKSSANPPLWPFVDPHRTSQYPTFSVSKATQLRQDKTTAKQL